MKKKLIITIAAGLLSFGGTFAVAWLTAKTPAATQAQQPIASLEQSEEKLPSPQAHREASRREASLSGLAGAQILPASKAVRYSLKFTIPPMKPHLINPAFDKERRILYTCPIENMNLLAGVA